jgi:predicted cupin superfamily sugar epimerase
MDAAELVQHFGMTRLPIEGTYFVRTFTSRDLAADGTAAGSAIIGLFSRELASRSLFHRVACDEMWHFYGGSPFRLVVLHPDGSGEAVVLGPEVLAGQRVQMLVPAGAWQAAELIDDGEWALFGCTVTPEFRPEHFESGLVGDLINRYPGWSDDITRLGVPDGSPRNLPDT